MKYSNHQHASFSMFMSIVTFLTLTLTQKAPAQTQGPGSESFDGPFANRTIKVWDQSAVTPSNPDYKGVLRFLSFPNFDTSITDTIGFDEAYIPNVNNTSELCKIEVDPLNPANRCLWMRSHNRPGETAGRNELGFGRPYVNFQSQPNGVPYTLAFRFFTPVELSRDVILMQGFSDFPWLRIMTSPSRLLHLDLAKTGSTSPTAAPDLTSAHTLSTYRVGSWNTVVLKVIHSNLETGTGAGRIDVFVNGNKMVTYIGRTTYNVGGSKIPYLKVGPYGPASTVYFDDVSWKADLIYPYTEVGFEANGIYSLEPSHAPGKRAGLNVHANGSISGSYVQLQNGAVSPTGRFLWTALAQGDGSFKLVSYLDPSKRLHVAGTAQGAPLVIDTDNTDSRKKWRAVWQQDGTYEIISQGNGIGTLRADVGGGSSNVGAQVLVWGDNNQPNQRWWLFKR